MNSRPVTFRKQAKAWDNMSYADDDEAFGHVVEVTAKVGYKAFAVGAGIPQTELMKTNDQVISLFKSLVRRQLQNDITHDEWSNEMDWFKESLSFEQLKKGVDISIQSVNNMPRLGLQVKRKGD